MSPVVHRKVYVSSLGFAERKKNGQEIGGWRTMKTHRSVHFSLHSVLLLECLGRFFLLHPGQALVLPHQLGQGNHRSVEVGD